MVAHALAAEQARVSHVVRSTVVTLVGPRREPLGEQKRPSRNKFQWPDGPWARLGWTLGRRHILTDAGWLVSCSNVLHGNGIHHGAVTHATGGFALIREFGRCGTWVQSWQCGGQY